MASETEVVGDVESAGGRSKSSTVAPRYFCAQDVSRAEGSEGVAGNPLDNVCAMGCWLGEAQIVPKGSLWAVCVI
jgi:hypothetical protein